MVLISRMHSIADIETKKNYIPPSERQVEQELRKYMGSSIPSRSFRMLQAMTAADELSGRWRTISNSCGTLSHPIHPDCSTSNSNSYTFLHLSIVETLTRLQPDTLLSYLLHRSSAVENVSKNPQKRIFSEIYALVVYL